MKTSSYRVLFVFLLFLSFNTSMESELADEGLAWEPHACQDSGGWIKMVDSPLLHLM